VPLYALSNWGKDTFAIAQTHERLGFLKHFDGMVISGHEGVIKPDPAIYELLCERYAIEPTDAVFIDDNESNIEAADRLGFHTVLFTNPDDLSTRLRTWGLF
jgi:2-haloacid dehalogenase